MFCISVYFYMCYNNQQLSEAGACAAHPADGECRWGRYAGIPLQKRGIGNYDECKPVDADCHHHLSGGNDRHRLDLLQAHVQRGRLLPGRPQAGPADHGDERRGLGHVVLAAAGPAGRGLHLGHCGRGLDGHRPGGGHLSELADRGQAHPRLHGPCERHHRAGLLLQALS